MNTSTMGRKPFLDPASRQKLLEWASMGTNLTEVAKTFGVKRDTVRRYIRGHVKNYMRDNGSH